MRALACIDVANRGVVLVHYGERNLEVADALRSARRAAQGTLSVRMDAAAGSRPDQQRRARCHRQSARRGALHESRAVPASLSGRRRDEPGRRAGARASISASSSARSVRSARGRSSAPASRRMSCRRQPICRPSSPLSLSTSRPRRRQRSRWLPRARSHCRCMKRATEDGVTFMLTPAGARARKRRPVTLGRDALARARARRAVPLPLRHGQVHRLQVLRRRVQRAERQSRGDQLAARRRDRRRLVSERARARISRWAATTASTRRA